MCSCSKCLSGLGVMVDIYMMMLIELSGCLIESGWTWLLKIYLYVCMCMYYSLAYSTPFTCDKILFFLYCIIFIEKIAYFNRSNSLKV